MGKRPTPESGSSDSDSSLSQKNKKSSSSPLQYTTKIQRKASSKPTTPPQEWYYIDYSVISTKALARLAKTYGFSHASTMCAQEHQQAYDPGMGWYA